jgi:hypothetical protein
MGTNAVLLFRYAYSEESKSVVVIWHERGTSHHSWTAETVQTSVPHLLAVVGFKLAAYRGDAARLIIRWRHQSTSRIVGGPGWARPGLAVPSCYIGVKACWLQHATGDIAAAKHFCLVNTCNGKRSYTKLPAAAVQRRADSKQLHA